MTILALVALSSIACAAPSTQDDSDSAESDLGEGRPWKVLNIDYQAQTKGYWCGPASTRIALSARGPAPSQGQLATQLGTDVEGTDSINQVTDVLNRHFGAGTYESVEMPNDPPAQWQRDRLWNDIVRNIDSGWVVVTNIVAPANNHPPGYPNYTVWHYFTVIGYNRDTREVFIADPASFSGKQLYWIPFDLLATLVPPKGYSASRRTGSRCSGTEGFTGGAIDEKFRSLGGCESFLGGPITEERATPDRIGRYNVFERGSIYWTPSIGAHEVHGAIRDRWRDLGWEIGALGYPITDETTAPDGRGRYSVFEKGSIYWTDKTGAHEVMGRIRDEWKARGWETGELGYPTSGQYDVAGGKKKNDFEHGSITWDASSDELDVVVKS
jgi:hypothetical protein